MTGDELDAGQSGTARFRAAPGAYHPSPDRAVSDEGDDRLLVSCRVVRLAPGVPATEGRFQNPLREQFGDRRFQGGGL